VRGIIVILGVFIGVAGCRSEPPKAPFNWAREPSSCEELDRFESRQNWLMRQGMYEQLLDEARGMTEGAPSGCMAHYLLGRAYSIMGRLKLAGQAYQRSLELAKDWPCLAPVAVKSLLGLGTIELRRRNLDRAVSYYKEALSRGPKDPLALAYLGALYLDQGQTGLAMDILQRLILAYPNSEKTDYLLGMFQFMRSRFQEAINRFDRAIDRDPDFFAARYARGYTLYRIDAFEQAYQDLSYAARLQLGNPQLLYLKAIVGLKLGRHLQEVEADLLNSIFLDPKFSLPYKTLGQLYEHQLKYPEAIKAYQRFCELIPAGEERDKIQKVITKLKERLK
jgi:tetratricopeptide (TPR) repeat protein